MNRRGRAIVFRAALEAACDPAAAELARVCAGIDPGFDPEAVREGAQLAEVPASQLSALVAAGDWPAVCVLADLAGDDPDSSVVRYNRAAWARLRDNP